MPRALEIGGPGADNSGMWGKRSGARRFAASVLTYSVATRVALTVIVAVVELELVLNLVWDVRAEGIERMFAAMVLFLLALWTFIGWRFLHHVWLPNVEWEADRRRADGLTERIASQLVDPRPHPNFAPVQPVVAEDGATVKGPSARVRAEQTHS